MFFFPIHLRVTRAGALRAGALALWGVLAASAHAQQTAASGVAEPQSPPPTQAVPASSHRGEISEEEIRQMLVGKPLILRDGYQDDTLRFNDHGGLLDSSPRGPFTLSGIEIDRVRLSRHKLELEGERYGLRFQGSDANSAPTGAVDRIRITPRKKTVKITIDRQPVVAAKKIKVPKQEAGKRAVATGAAAAGAGQPGVASAADQGAGSGAAEPGSLPARGPASTASAASAEQAADTLRAALDRVFSVGVDDTLVAALPPYWKIYYEDLREGKDFKPSDPSVLRPSEVDRKARLVSVFEPKSNDLAQAHGIAGIALVHTVIGADGKPEEIVLGQPIGFGLDENAVTAIRNATFEPAMKGGKPVAVALDLTVQFHIYSKLTSAATTAPAADKAPAAELPGPYSAQHP